MNKTVLILDDKLRKTHASVQERLGRIFESSGFEVRVHSVSKCEEAVDLVVKTKPRLVVLHRNEDYFTGILKPGENPRAVLRSKILERAHLIWTSTVGVDAKSVTTLAKSGVFHEMLLSTPLPSTDYLRPNWKGMLEDWRRKIDDSSVTEGSFPAPSIKLLIQPGGPADLHAVGILLRGLIELTGKELSTRGSGTEGIHWGDGEWRQNIIRPHETARVSGPGEGRYWFDPVTAEVVGRSFDELVALNPPLGSCKNLRALWTLLRAGALDTRLINSPSLREADAESLPGEIESPSKLRGLVANAYLEFKREHGAGIMKAEGDLSPAPAKPPPIDGKTLDPRSIRLLIWSAAREYMLAIGPAGKLESSRRLFNHNRLKNEFVARLVDPRNGTGTGFLRAFWGKPRGLDPETLELRRGEALKAIRAWDTLRGELEELLLRLPARLGFRLTPKFEEAARVLFQGEDSAVAVIGRLARRWRDGPSDTAACAPESDLGKFFAAIDQIQGHLSLMGHRPENGEWFGGYYEPDDRGTVL